MQEQINKILGSIGLNESEIKIYLDLVKQNISSALEISKRTKVYRSNTYDTLRRLIEKGFVKETVKDNKKMFRATDPEKIKDYIKQKEQEIDLIIPKIKESISREPEKETVSITKGIFAFRNALLGLLELNKPINVYGIRDGAIKFLGEGFIKEFHKQRVRKKIMMRHIYNQEAKERIKELNKIPFTEARHLSKKYNSLVSTNICGDTVVIIVFSNSISVIEIKNKEIADTYNKYFEILWKHAIK